MADLWLYRVDVFVPDDELPDLTGFEVVSNDDERLGTVDEATTDAGSSWIIVDTGFWIFGKKRMIPAGTIQRVDREEQRVHVAVSKDEIKDAPDYDKALEFQDAYRQEMSDYYRSRSPQH
jgi:hypothetical protein